MEMMLGVKSGNIEPISVDESASPFAMSPKLNFSDGGFGPYIRQPIERLRPVAGPHPEVEAMQSVV
jgi:hypothetical protein